MESISKLEDRKDPRSQVCIFCLKLTSSKFKKHNTVVWQNFVKCWSRFVEVADLKKFFESFIDNQLIQCCGDCFEITTKFCEMYNQLKILEMNLEWKLTSLTNIVQLANRIPSRFLEMREWLAKQCSETLECKEKAIERLNSFRQRFTNKSKTKLDESKPRVLLKRHKTIEANTQIKLNNSFNASSGLESLDSSKMLEYFLGWIMSLNVVFTLATGNVSENVNFRRADPTNLEFEEENENLIEDLEIDFNAEDVGTAQCSTGDDTDDHFEEASYHSHEEIRNPNTTDAGANDDVISSSDILKELDGNQIVLNIKVSPSKQNDENLSTSRMANMEMEEMDNKSENTEHLAQLDCNEIVSNIKAVAAEHDDDDDRQPKQTIGRATEQRNNELERIENLTEPPHMTSIAFKEEHVATPDAIQVTDQIPEYNSRKRNLPTYDEQLSDEDDNQHRDKDYDDLENDSEMSDSSYDDDSDGSLDPDIKTEPQKLRKNSHLNNNYQAIKRTFKGSTHLFCSATKCGKFFYTPEHLKIHETYHGTFNCGFCNVVKIYAPDLAIHEAEKHTSGDKDPNYKYICASCNFKTAIKTLYVRHYLQSHLKLENITFVCTICQCEYTDKQGLKEHVRDTHEPLADSEVFKCTLCPATFTKPTMLVNHYNKVHLKNKTCPVCKKVMRKYLSVRKHIKAKHPEIEIDPYACYLFKCESNGCGKRFFTKNMLQKHKAVCKQLQKTKIDKFSKIVKCAECNKEFKGKCGLQGHIKRMHTLEKPSIFEICDNCQVQIKRENRQNHFESYHNTASVDPTNIRKCNVPSCSAFFVTKRHRYLQYWNKHKQIHKNTNGNSDEPVLQAKPQVFSCVRCDTLNGSKDELNNHMQNFHQEPNLESLKSTTRTGDNDDDDDHFEVTDNDHEDIGNPNSVDADANADETASCDNRTECDRNQIVSKTKILSTEQGNENLSNSRMTCVTEKDNGIEHVKNVSRVDRNEIPSNANNRTEELSFAGTDDKQSQLAIENTIKSRNNGVEPIENLLETYETPQCDMETSSSTLNTIKEEHIETPDATQVTDHIPKYSLRKRKLPNYKEQLAENDDDDQQIDEDYNDLQVSENDSEMSNSSYEDDSDASLDSETNPVTRKSPNNSYKQIHLADNYQAVKRTFKGSTHLFCSATKCGKFFYTPEHLKIHETYHGTFKCGFCDVIIDYAPDLAIHEAEKHNSGGDNDTNYNYSCASCDFKSAIKTLYVRHYLQTHLKLENITFVCTICQSEYTDKQGLKEHVKDTHDTLADSEVYKCTLCQATFTKPTVLVNHCNKVHLKNKTCPVCKKVMRRYQTLRKHIKHKHPEIDPYACYSFKCDRSGCEEMFSTKNILERHKKACDEIHKKRENRLSKIVKCAECKKQFNGENNLQEHIKRMHTFEKPSIFEDCDICKVPIKKEKKHNHFQLCHNTDSVDPAKIRKCDIPNCSTYFVTKRYNYLKYWEKHQQIHRKVDDNSEEPVLQTDKAPVFSCISCGMFYNSQDELEDHTQNFHQKASVDTVTRATKISTHFFCSVAKCGKYFNTPEHLKIHETHHGTFKCRFCDVVMDYAPDLAIHEAEKHRLEENDSEYKYSCAGCDYKSTIESTYIRHFLRSHLGLENISFVCTICQSEYADKSNLRQHVKDVHPSKKSDDVEEYKCNLCPATFTNSKVLVYHYNKVHLKDKTCPVCQKVMAEFRDLRVHIKRVHPEIDPYACFPFKCENSGCEVRFSTKYRLEKHKPLCEEIQNKKNTKHCKIVKCDECDREFKGEGKLKQHKKFTHEEANHVCTECGKSFRGKQRLDMHMEFHKPPEQWKFQCSECGRKFALKHKLTDHARTHTKEKPFVCQFCGVKYAHRHNWRNHVKSKHPEEDEASLQSSGRKGNFMSRKGSKKGECIIAGKCQQ